MKYYVLTIVSIYDGLEFSSNLVCASKKKLTDNEAYKIAQEMVVREVAGEELQYATKEEITKKEYEIIRKYVATIRNIIY